METSLSERLVADSVPVVFLRVRVEVSLVRKTRTIPIHLGWVGHEYSLRSGGEGKGGQGRVINVIRKR